MSGKGIVIIGSGLAGYMLAKEFRKLDTATPLTIITASDGRFYSKPLLSTAMTQNKTADALAMNDAADMQAQLNARIETHAVVSSIDAVKQEVIVGDKAIPYERLVFACGAETISPPLMGDAVGDVRSVNDLEAYAEFRQTLAEKKRIAILGSGLVGCEFSNDLINAGYDVNVIAPDHYPLAALVPERVGQVLQAALKDKGVAWHLGQLATDVNRVDARYAVTLGNGETVEADLVLSAIGLRPSCNLAESAGVEINRGIVVDRYLRTSVPTIYALGDCAEVVGHVKQYVAPLLQCSRALAKTLAQADEPVHYPSMPVAIKTPACPVVVSPVPAALEGEWQYEGEGANLQALFYDQEGQLRGFALVGDKVRQRMALAKQLPEVFA